MISSIEFTEIRMRGTLQGRGEGYLKCRAHGSQGIARSRSGNHQNWRLGIYLQPLKILLVKYKCQCQCISEEVASYSKLSLISTRHTSFYTIMSLNFSGRKTMSLIGCPLQQIMRVLILSVVLAVFHEKLGYSTCMNMSPFPTKRVHK